MLELCISVGSTAPPVIMTAFVYLCIHQIGVLFKLVSNNQLLT